MLQWLAENWDSIAYAIGVILGIITAGKVGQHKGQRDAQRELSRALDSTTPVQVSRSRTPPDAGFALLQMMVILAALLSPYIGCGTLSGTADPYEALRQQQRHDFESRSTKWVMLVDAMHTHCLSLASACAALQDYSCSPLVECQRFKADMATAYADMLRHLAEVADMIGKRRPESDIQAHLKRASDRWTEIQKRIGEELQDDDAA
jgi:hypothetical protein